MNLRRAKSQFLPALALMLACVAVAAQAAIIYWPLPGLDIASQRALGLNCLNNLLQIRWAARAWSLEHNEQFPSSFQLFTNNLDSPALLFCPEDVSRPPVTNWDSVDWDRIDYQWLPQTNWNNPDAICCKCRIHENDLRVDGIVPFTGRFRSGWPVILAGPLGQSATPGSELKFEVKIAPNSALPVSYQWRREQLYYLTNVIFISETNYPGGGYWVTNRTGKFSVTLLNGETNSSYIIANAQTNHSDYYSVTVSNVLGTSASRGAHLVIDSNVASMATNEHWSAVNCLNNLKQIALLGRIWAQDHNEHMPQALLVMTNSFGLPLFGWPVVLFCRADPVRTAPPDWPGFNFNNTSYELLAGDEQDANSVFCRCTIHGFYAQMDGEAVSAPHFFEIRTVTNGVAELSFKIFAGHTNVLEASTNLADWTALKSYSSTNGTLVYCDTDNLPGRFYRLRVK